MISRSCKNDHIIFNVETPSLEARNIRLVNIITYWPIFLYHPFSKWRRMTSHKVGQSSIKHMILSAKCHSLLNFVSHATSFMYFRHFYIDSEGQKRVRRLGLSFSPGTSNLWALCSFAYLRWRRWDVCNFHMIYIDDIIHNCMCVIFWTWSLSFDNNGLVKPSWRTVALYGPFVFF
jgi:hypothetical protein